MMRATPGRWAATMMSLAMTIAVAFPASAATHSSPQSVPSKASAPARAQSTAVPARPKAAPPLAAESVNSTVLPPPAKGGALPRSALLRAQILLDRAHFSSGEIDARSGSNLTKAIAAYQKQRQLNSTGKLDAPTWDALNQDTLPALIEYTIAPADVAGPFVKIPPKMEDKAQLPALGYASPLEWLGEKFHASPNLLRELNPKKDFGRAGETVLVPNVGITSLEKADKGARVVVSKSLSAVM